MSRREREARPATVTESFIRLAPEASQRLEFWMFRFPRAGPRAGAEFRDDRLQMSLFAEAEEAVAGTRVEYGDDVEDAGAGAETHGGNHVRAVADPDLVSDAAGDGVRAQALIASDGAQGAPYIDEGDPGDGGTAATVVTARGHLEGETIAQLADGRSAHRRTSR